VTENTSAPSSSTVSHVTPFVSRIDAVLFKINTARNEIHPVAPKDTGMDLPAPVPKKTATDMSDKTPKPPAKEFNAEELVRVIKNVSTETGLDLLQEYDKHCQATDKIGPVLIGRLRRMNDDEAMHLLHMTIPSPKFVISSRMTRDSRFLSLFLPGHIATLDDRRTFPIRALFDTGCTNSSIDSGFVKERHIATTTYDIPFHAYNADGSPSIGGKITDFVELRLTLG